VVEVQLVLVPVAEVEMSCPSLHAVLSIALPMKPSPLQHQTLHELYTLQSTCNISKAQTTIYFVISRLELCDRDWSNAHHGMCKNKQCCLVLSVQRHVPGNMASHDPCFWGTWCKPHDTMHLHQFFGPTSVLGRSLCILSCCIIDDDTNLLHLFCDTSITDQILTVGPQATLHNFRAFFFNADRG